MPTLNMPASTPYEPMGSYRALLGMQKEQAEAQEEQIKNLQAQQSWKIRNDVANYWMTDDPSKYDEHGIRRMDVTARDMYQIAGPEANQYIQAAAKTAQDQTDLYTKTVQMTDSERDLAARNYAGAFLDPQVTKNFKSKSDIVSYIDGLGKGLPTNVRKIGLDMLTRNPPPDPQGPNNTYIPDQQDAKGNIIPGQLSQYAHDMRNLIRPVLAASTISEQATEKAGIQDVGGSLVPTVQAPALQGGAVTTGKPIGKSLSPTVVTPPGGIPEVWGGGGQGNGKTRYPGPPPTTQDLENFQAYSNNLNARVQQGTDALTRINATELALSKIRSGAGSATRASLAQTLQALNAPKSLVDAVAGGDLGKTQEAEKFLFQTTLQGLRQSMQGDPARVAEFNAADRVFPNIDTDPRAKQKILDFMEAQANRDYAEQQALNTSRSEGTFNPATWQADYQKMLRAGKVPGVPASQIPTSAKEGSDQIEHDKNGKPMKKGADGKWHYVR